MMVFLIQRPLDSFTYNISRLWTKKISLSPGTEATSATPMTGFLAFYLALMDLCGQYVTTVPPVPSLAIMSRIKPNMTPQSLKMRSRTGEVHLAVI
jgi:hypothetical protein